MTPKEKAIELIDKFTPFVNKKVVDHYYEKLEWMVCKKEELRNAKQCALIAVENFVYFIESHNNEWFGWSKDLQYWQEVKQEINKL